MQNKVLSRANSGLQELATVYGLICGSGSKLESNGSEIGILVHSVINFTIGSPCIPEGIFYPGRNLRILSKVVLIGETVKLIFGLVSVEEVTELLIKLRKSDYFWWSKSEYIVTKHTIALPA